MKLGFATLGCPDWDLETIALAIEASNLTEMKGYSATITYDPNQLR